MTSTLSDYVAIALLTKQDEMHDEIRVTSHDRSRLKNIFESVKILSYMGKDDSFRGSFEHFPHLSLDTIVLYPEGVSRFSFDLQEGQKITGLLRKRHGGFYISGNTGEGRYSFFFRNSE